MLPKEAIKEFQEIWKREFGEEISEEEASRRGIELIELFQLIAPKEEDLLNTNKYEPKQGTNSIIKEL